MVDIFDLENLDEKIKSGVSLILYEELVKLNFN
jgi:hypothetical protein